MGFIKNTAVGASKRAGSATPAAGGRILPEGQTQHEAVGSSTEGAAGMGKIQEWLLVLSQLTSLKQSCFCSEGEEESSGQKEAEKE